MVPWTYMIGSTWVLRSISLLLLLSLTATSSVNPNALVQASSFPPLMSSPYYVPAGAEAAPTSSQTSQPGTSPILTLRSSSSSIGISPASTVSIVIFLSLFTLAALVAAICWIRRRRTTSTVPGEQPLEKAPVRDVEALAATGPSIPVSPLPGVRWTPQIRSISGPASDKDSDSKSAAPHPKRARSPPPSNLMKPRNLFSPHPHEPHPKSAPARALSFSQNETFHSEKSWERELDPPVTPQALAVSGMQTRSLGRPGLGSKS